MINEQSEFIRDLLYDKIQELDYKNKTELLIKIRAVLDGFRHIRALCYFTINDTTTQNDEIAGIIRVQVNVSISYYLFEMNFHFKDKEHKTIDKQYNYVTEMLENASKWRKIEPLLEEIGKIVGYSVKIVKK